MRSSSIHVATFAALAALSGSLSATTLERLSMDAMTAQSTVVVRATVTSGGGELNNGAISTHYQLRVSEVWKGSAGGTLDVYVPGGTANGFRQLVPGAPVLTVGSDYVVFLWIGRSGRPQIMGLSQGLFTVSKDAAGALILQRPGVKEMIVDPKTNRPISDATMRMKATELQTFVQKRQNTK